MARMELTLAVAAFFSGEQLDGATHRERIVRNPQIVAGGSHSPLHGGCLTLTFTLAQRLRLQGDGGRG